MWADGLSWWRSSFFFAKWVHCFAIRRRMNSVIRHSKIPQMDYYLWISENGGHHLSGWYDSLRILWSRLAMWSSLLLLFLGLRCVQLDPCFGYEATVEISSNFRLNSANHCCEVISLLRLLFEVGKYDTDCVVSFLIPNISSMICMICKFFNHLLSAICQYELVCGLIVRDIRFQVRMYDYVETC